MTKGAFTAVALGALAAFGVLGSLLGPGTTGVIGLWAEGFGGMLLPCSVTIALPAVAVAIASRQHSTAGLCGFGVALVGFTWLRLAGHGAELSQLTIAGLLAAGTVLVLAPIVRRLDAVTALGGLLVGVATASLWSPCRGTNLDALVVELPSRGLLGLALLGVYLLGLGVPVIVVGAVLHIVPAPVMRPVNPIMMVAGGATLIVLTLGVAAGLHDELIEHVSVLAS